MVGRMGYPVFLAVRTSSISELTSWIGSYHEAWKAAGHPGRGEVGVIVPVYVAETARRAREEPEASAMHFYRSIGQALAKSATTTMRTETGHRLIDISYDEVLARVRRLRHAGGGRRPAAGAARDARLLDALGVDERRRAGAARARAGVDATLRRARHAAAGVNAFDAARRPRDPRGLRADGPTGRRIAHPVRAPETSTRSARATIERYRGVPGPSRLLESRLEWANCLRLVGLCCASTPLASSGSSRRPMDQHMPTAGEAAIKDRTDNPVFGRSEVRASAGDQRLSAAPALDAIEAIQASSSSSAARGRWTAPCLCAPSALPAGGGLRPRRLPDRASRSPVTFAAPERHHGRSGRRRRADTTERRPALDRLAERGLLRRGGIWERLFRCRRACHPRPRQRAGSRWNLRRAVARLLRLRLACRGSTSGRRARLPIEFARTHAPARSDAPSRQRLKALSSRMASLDATGRIGRGDVLRGQRS